MKFRFMQNGFDFIANNCFSKNHIKLITYCSGILDSFENVSYFYFNSKVIGTFETLIVFYEIIVHKHDWIAYTKGEVNLF